MMNIKYYECSVYNHQLIYIFIHHGEGLKNSLTSVNFRSLKQLGLYLEGNTHSH